MTASSRYRYECAECGGKVTKPACRKVAKGEAILYHGLGGWVCAECGPGIKVKRELLGKYLKIGAESCPVIP